MAGAQTTAANPRIQHDLILFLRKGLIMLNVIAVTSDCHPMEVHVLRIG
jgi:hypothetical protein